LIASVGSGDNGLTRGQCSEPAIRTFAAQVFRDELCLRSICRLLKSPAVLSTRDGGEFLVLGSRVRSRVRSRERDE